MTTGTRVAFIGGGNMAHAIAGGLLRSGFAARDLLIAEPDPARRAFLGREFPAAGITDDNTRAAAAADTLVLAVKPQILRPVCEALRAAVQARRPLVISIAAGPSSADIDNWLGGGQAVVRVMPNQPALIDRGISAMYSNEHAGKDARRTAETILGAVGETAWISEESLMDAITAISGTGPAYVYLLMDVMLEAAIAFGIPRDTALKLVFATTRGAAELAAADTDTLAGLIERVRSPGGTTTAAFERLEAADVRAIFASAILAAKERAGTLAEEARA